MPKRNDERAEGLADALMGHVLVPVDFDAIDALAEKLGERSAGLSPEERAAAAEFIDEWSRTTCGRVMENTETAKRILDFLDGKDFNYGSALDVTVELFRDVAGDLPEYAAYAEAHQAYASVEALAPVPEIPGNDAAVSEADVIEERNYAAKLRHDRLLRQAAHDCHRATKDLMAAIDAMPGMAKAKAKLSAYKRKAPRVIEECRAKADAARMNVTVSDPEARAVLRELAEFAKTV